MSALRSDDEPPELLAQTLAGLSGQLLLIEGAAAAERRQVDLVHESLIGGWPQLAEWVDTYRELELLRRSLEQLAASWAAVGRRGELLDGGALGARDRLAARGRRRAGDELRAARVPACQPARLADAPA